jgi:hypothetical protein
VIPAMDPSEVHSTLADDVEPPPPYDKAALQIALIAERASEAKAETALADAEATGESDRIRVSRDNLAVRQRFIQTLEVCESQDRMCPPRLDEPAWPYAIDSEADPKLDVPLRFDLASWRKVTAELHGRACACRTMTCIDSFDATIGRLEGRPMEDIQDDDAATTSLTRARECLFRLRGKKHFARRDPN